MELEKVYATLEAHTGDYMERVTFANGRGASIIRHRGSYGGRTGLFELAVLDADGDLDYSTPVTGDVLGWLTVAEVVEALQAIAELPPVTPEIAS